MDIICVLNGFYILPPISLVLAIFNVLSPNEMLSIMYTSLNPGTHLVQTVYFCKGSFKSQMSSALNI